MLKISNIMINSENPKDLTEFYGKVLDKSPDWEDEENSMAGFMMGSCFLSIMPHDKVKGKNSNPERIIFFFEAEDVKAEYDRIKSLGAEVIAEPYSPGGDNTLLATLADPDGNYFQLASPWKM